MNDEKGCVHFGECRVANFAHDWLTEKLDSERNSMEGIAEPRGKKKKRQESIVCRVAPELCGKFATLSKWLVGGLADAQRAHIVER